MSQVKQLLSARLTAPWADLSVCPRTCTSHGARLCTYERWFAGLTPGHTPHRLLKLPLSAKTMRALIRFRTGCHSLPVDIGRRGNAVPRLQRYCLLCQTHTIGDEQHIVFECPALQDLRQRYHVLFQDGHMTMRQFMWQDNLVQVAHFIKDSLARVLDESSDATHAI